MEQQELNALLEKSISLNEPGEYRIVIGEEQPDEVLSEKKLLLSGLTMDGLCNFVKQRQDYIRSRRHESHFLLNTREHTITLVIGEHGVTRLKGQADYKPVIILEAKSHFSDDYKQVKRYMGKSHPSAHDFAMELRNNMEHLFETKAEWARVVGALRNTSTKISTIKKDTSEDAGAREKRMVAEVTEGKLDLTWNWFVPIFEGEDPVHIEATAIWEVQPNFMDVHLVLLNGGLKRQERSAEDEMFKETVEALNQMIGLDTALPMIYIDNDK